MAFEDGSIGHPIRTCIGCRQLAPQQELLRVVLHGNSVVPDQDRKLDGRGAYLHQNIECVDRAVLRRSYTRPLRATTSLDLEQLLALFK